MALFLLFALLLLILSGFLPGRSLQVKRGRWYYIGIFNKILFIVNGDTAFALIPLFWPFRLIQTELSWTEYEQMNEVYEGGVRRYTNVEKAIGTKTAFTNIRKIEEHPIEVEVILSDGHKVNLIFDTTLTVFNPMLLVPVKQFLTYVQQEFSDVVSHWAKKNKDIDSILEINIDILEKELELEHEGSQYTLRTYLDTLKFEPRGFCIKELSMKVGLPADAQKYFDIKNQTKHEEAELLRLKAVEKRKEQSRIIFTNDANTEREVQAKDLKITEEYQLSLINALYTGQKEVASSYKASTLVINSADGGKNDVEQAKMLTSALTAGLITHNRLPKDDSDTEPKEKK